MTAGDHKLPAQAPRAADAAAAPEGAPAGLAPRTGRGWLTREALYRRALFALGCLLLTAGAIGMVVPMLPGTVFLILAAWCFARSSPRFEAWLLTHPYLGPSVARWKATGAIPPLAKVMALSSFVGTFGGAWYFGAPHLVLVPLGVVFTGLAAFMVTRPNA